jgi:hypothetical protein
MDTKLPFLLRANERRNLVFRALIVVLIGAFIVTFALSAGEIDPVRPTPIVRTLTPSPAKAGVEIVAGGQFLGKEFVTSVYLTQGDNTYESKIDAQADTSIKFKVPSDLKPGKFGVMVLTHETVPRYIDEPVYLVIE